MSLPKWFVPCCYFQSEGNITANLQLYKHEHAQRVTSNNSSYDLPSSPSPNDCIATTRCPSLMAAIQTQI